ncbi:MAG: hypothetical protein ACLUNZ_08720 [Evtepia sp.]
MQKQYKLLTPGPLTTTDTVKQVMLFDHCTWDDDYKQITQSIRAQLLELAHVSAPDYTAVLMQGSGSFEGRVGADQRHRSGRKAAHRRQRRLWSAYGRDLPPRRYCLHPL